MGMDNITHSLIGVAVAQSFGKRKADVQKAAVWTALLGSNLPDLDFLSRPLGLSGNLGYLLQHRGYTHTLLLSLPIGMIAAFLGVKIARLTRKKENTEILGLIFIGWLSVLLHIFMDWRNNYGVHPFSPFWNRWYYGDSIFIIEPLLWFCLLPLIFKTAKSAWTRGLSFGLGALMLGIVWFTLSATWSVVAGVSAWALLFIVLQRKSSSVRYAAGGFATVLAVFGYTSAQVHQKLERYFVGMAPNVQVVQLSASPAPSNPFCWQFSGLTVENSRDYVGRTGIYNLAPSWFSSEDCHFLSRLQQGNTLKPVPGDFSSTGITWHGEFRSSVTEFNRLRNSDCGFEAALRFLRIPFWWGAEHKVWASDLRYDRGGDRGRRGRFSQIELSSSSVCPSGELPPWEPPTHELWNMPEKVPNP